MEVLVLGSGVIGVTTAWMLSRRGHGVTVLEKAGSAGQATSFANGGQLSYSYADPLASPALLAKLPGLLSGRDPAFRIHPALDPALLDWGLRLLRNCTAQRSRYHTRNILRLALYSRARLHRLLEEQPMEFDYRRSGKLHVYADPESLRGAVQGVELKNQWGCGQQLLDRDQCLEREPALARWPDPIAGGVFSPLDESGDAFTFTAILAEHCRAWGVRFLYHTEIRRLVAAGGRLVRVESSRGSHEADAYVMSLGAHSPLLSRPIGLKLPVYPLKGYSLTVPASAAAPRMSITDTRRKVVYCTLGGRLRVAGMAELHGYDDTLDQDRLDSLLEAARRSFPEAADYGRVFHRWAGFRPATPDSAPVLGRTPLENFFLNSGQGMLGWTLACGSAAVVADVVEGRTPEIDLAGLTVDRFLGAG